MTVSLGIQLHGLSQCARADTRAVSYGVCAQAFGITSQTMHASWNMSGGKPDEFEGTKPRTQLKSDCGMHKSRPVVSSNNMNQVSLIHLSWMQKYSCEHIHSSLISSRPITRGYHLPSQQISYSSPQSRWEHQDQGTRSQERKTRAKRWTRPTGRTLTRWTTA